MKGIDIVLIPTLGRMDKQTTYEALPPHLQDLTHFVVQSHEFEPMKERYPNVICLPKTIKTIEDTREWLQSEYNDVNYVMIDDDVKFLKVDHPHNNAEGKWKKTHMTAQDFMDWELWLISEWKAGHVLCGMCNTVAPPSVQYWPTKYNGRVLHLFAWNGRAKNKPDMTGCWLFKWAEDMHFTLEILTRGYKIPLSAEFVIGPGAGQAKGGCSTTRTIKGYNHQMREFEKRWPDYVKVVPKINKGGVWKGLLQNKVRVQWAKAWKHGQMNKS